MSANFLSSNIKKSCFMLNSWSCFTKSSSKSSRMSTCVLIWVGVERSDSIVKLFRVFGGIKNKYYLDKGSIRSYDIDDFQKG